jgi:hypothetical protein
LISPTDWTKIFIVHFLCSPKENEPKERAPSHSVLRTTLRFSKGPALEETRFAQTVHERHPDLSAMLDLVTMGLNNDLGRSLVIIFLVPQMLLEPPAMRAEIQCLLVGFAVGFDLGGHDESKDL